MPIKKILLIIGLITSNLSFGQLPPAKVTGLTASQFGLTNTMNIAWSSSASAIGYKVYKKEGGITDSVRLGNVTTYTATNLRLSTSYRVWVRAFRTGALSTDTLYSVSSDTLTVPMVELVAPAITAETQNITSTGIGVRLTDSNISESGFEIQFSSSAGISIRTAGPGSVLFLPYVGFTPKTTYTIRARAVYGSFFGPWSTTITVTTKIDFPPMPVVTSTSACPTTVIINWNITSRPEDIGEFLIQRSFDNVVFNNYGSLNPDVRTVTDLDAVPGKTIFYRVLAINSTGITQTPSITVNTPSFVAPTAAINVTSDKTNKSRNHLTIKWTNPAEDLVCKTNIRKETLVLVKLANETDYRQFASLFPGETSIKVDGLKPKDIVDVAILYISDKGIQSTRSVVRDTTAGPPYTPSNLIIVDGKNALNNSFLELRWKDNSNDEDYFIIERGTNNINFTQIGKINYNLTNFVDLTIEENRIYYYRIKAGSNTEGESLYTSTVFGIINPQSIPNMPVGLLAKVSGLKVNLTWYDDSINEENFVIEKSVDASATFTVVATLGKNIISYVDENVLTGKTYTYRVKATNEKGSSLPSNLATVVIGTSGMATPITLNSVNVYPNPTNSLLKIKLGEGDFDSNGKIVLINKENRIIFSKDVIIKANNEIEIDLSKFDSGLYNLNISNGNSSISKKVYIF